MLRCSGGVCLDGSAKDVFSAMSACTDTAVWRLVVGELLITRHPATEDTLLHVAARANNLEAVRVCMSHSLNPLLRNNSNKLAADAATDKAVIEELRRYALWRPKRKVMQWYGPYFRNSARTFLLVCERWRAKRVRVVTRDVRMLILSHLAAMESTYVKQLEPKKMIKK